MFNRRLFHGLSLALSVALASMTQDAVAHDNAELGSGRHGGMVQASDNYHLETVIDGDTVTVWVTDHSDEAQSTAGASGKAIIFRGNKRISIDLRPAGG